jgi:hypothetical protein
MLVLGVEAIFNDVTTKKNIFITQTSVIGDRNVTITAINSFIKHILPPYPKEFLVITVTVALVDTIILVCLALTFITYSLFPSLRSLPGKNNMRNS